MTYFRKKFKIHSKEGFSLIEMMMFVAVSAILTMVMSQMYINQVKSVKSYELNSELLDLRRIVRARTDCAQTKAAAADWSACLDGPIEIRDSSNQIVISSGGQNFGSYVLQANCNTTSSNALLIISVRRGEKVISEDLFKTIPLQCPL